MEVTQLLLTPDEFENDGLWQGTVGRVHLQKNSVGTIWLLDERTINTVIIEVAQHRRGQYFRPHEQGIFPHLSR